MTWEAHEHVHCKDVTEKWGCAAVAVGCMRCHELEQETVLLMRVSVVREKIAQAGQSKDCERVWAVLCCC